MEIGFQVCIRLLLQVSNATLIICFEKVTYEKVSS